jgi:hypothetical protein
VKKPHTEPYTPHQIKEYGYVTVKFPDKTTLPAKIQGLTVKENGDWKINIIDRKTEELMFTLLIEEG